MRVSLQRFQNVSVWTLLAAAVFASPVEAQVVEVQPGYIPGAGSCGIFRTPDGRTRIRAPFVDVDADEAPPRWAWRRRRAHQAAQGLESQRAQLTQTWRQLDRRLAARPNGQLWSAHLALPAWVISPPAEGLPQDAVGQLQTVVNRYEITADEPRYRTIARIGEFQSTRKLLAAYTQMLESSLESATVDERIENEVEGPAPGEWSLPLPPALGPPSHSESSQPAESLPSPTIVLPPTLSSQPMPTREGAADAPALLPPAR